jgi:hypothetical protein
MLIRSCFAKMFSTSDISAKACFIHFVDHRPAGTVRGTYSFPADACDFTLWALVKELDGQAVDVTVLAGSQEFVEKILLEEYGGGTYYLTVNKNEDKESNCTQQRNRLMEVDLFSETELEALVNLKGPSAVVPGFVPDDEITKLIRQHRRKWLAEPDEMLQAIEDYPRKLLELDAALAARRATAAASAAFAAASASAASSSNNFRG